MHVQNFLVGCAVTVITACATTPNETAVVKPNMAIGTYTGTGSHGVYLVHFDEATGKLQILDSLSAENPSFLAYSSQWKTLYALQENGGDKAGRVGAWQYQDSSGKYALVADKLTGGDHPCYVSLIEEQQLVTLANYTGGSVSVLRLSDKGVPLDSSMVHQRQGSGPNTARQEKAHVHTSFYHQPSGRLWIADLGTDEIVGYRVAAGAVNFTDSIGIKTAPGAGPRHLAFHPTLPLLYAVYELKGEVAVWDYSSAVPSLLQTIKTDTISANPGSADIHLSADGRFVYVSNRIDANSISVLGIDGKGLLTVAGHYSTYGSTPRNFMVRQNHVLVANQNSDNIVIFERNNQTGALGKVLDSISIAKPVCIIDL